MEITFVILGIIVAFLLFIWLTYTKTDNFIVAKHINPMNETSYFVMRLYKNFFFSHYVNISYVMQTKEEAVQYVEDLITYENFAVDREPKINIEFKDVYENK